MTQQPADVLIGLAPPVCSYCEYEPEPGFFETDNNGPIVRCPLCERREFLRTQSQDKAHG